MALLLHMTLLPNGMRLTLATSDVYYFYYACYHVPLPKCSLNAKVRLGNVP